MTPPERDPDSVARAWEDLVRRLQEDDASADSAAAEAAPAHGAPVEEVRSHEAPIELEDRARGPRDFELAPETDEPELLDDDWQPQDPGPVTAGMRPGTIMAWAVLLGVAAALLVLGFLLDGLPWWLWVPGLALILGSLVSLFQALPEDRSDDDDGAQV
ncbi:UNVERIFIED_CONTAM: hypothetical protein RF649_04330 [Kocuria sp. CPCC 205295]|uniref:hypothetical protein n=1 Tax=unclassified Kocuria TaxID=2649579 RepID=UPI0034D52112